MANQNSRRSAIWHALKAAGWEPTVRFVNTSLPMLEAELERFQTENGVTVVIDEPLPPTAPVAPEIPEETAPAFDPSFQAPAATQRPAPPVQAHADPNELPGQRVNTQPLDEPIRVDEQGRLWYQEEVRKPAYPKPRGRRILRYNETGVKTQTVQAGEYVESFEVAGEGPGIPAEIKITLPSYQVGIYKDPRFPFRIHTYNGRDGFDLFEVQEFYGGAELVPAEVKRIYVENHLCYDVRSVIRAIQSEYRQNQLIGRVQ